MTRIRLRAQGHDVEVKLVDKFPRMLDYVVPSGVRIADANRVRLGAHLADGTTVMHEGYCNFNAVRLLFACRTTYCSPLCRYVIIP